uniref:Ig-like domain-containing protein n=1 Tax=Poecilia reticulata TaxID=8081 RepID=A0A3P9PAV8_POERE
QISEVSVSSCLAAVIQTQQTVLAAVGEDAPLSCHLLETKDVQQVTWQKVLEKTERNIGSYSEYYGETVNDGFKDKVQFTEAGLMYQEDYRVHFYNLMSTIMSVLSTELHGPFIDVRSRSNSPSGSVVTGSATGRTVPMVTLTVLHQNLSFSHCNTSRETNTNSTVTVTTTALLSALSSTQVGCLVSVDSAAPRELLVTIPEFKDSSDDEKTYRSVHYSKSIHPFSLHPCPSVGSGGVLVPLQLTEAGFTLDRSPVYRRATQRHTGQGQFRQTN